MSTSKWELVLDRCRTPGSAVLSNWQAVRAVEQRQQLEAFVSRAADRIATRAFDAADTPAWTSSWATHTGSLNQDIERGGAVLVSRSRSLSRNNDWARRFQIQLRHNVLGPQGMRLQMRLKKRNGEANKLLNDAAESFWSKWGKRGNCEVTGKLTWRECEQLLLDHLARDGEWLFRYLPVRGPLGFQIQILDPQSLDVTYRGTYGGRDIRMGVEIDADGKPAAYWLRAKSDVADYAGTGYGDQRRIRIPAEEINHFFITEEAGQLRGMPWIVAGMRRLFLVKDFEEAAAVASSNAAKRVGFFVSPNGDAPPGFADQIVSQALDDAKRAGRTLSAAEVQIIKDSAQKFATTAPGQYDVIPQGYDFKSHDSAFPHINYGEYVKECLRGFTAGVGMSYATAGNNLEAVNFSSARVGVLDEREVFKLLQETIAEAGPEAVFAQALKFGLLASPLLAGFPANRYDEALDCAAWIKRRWVGIDPLKEANSNDINLKNRLTSPQRIITGLGEDPDEIADEIEQWEKRFGPIGGQATPQQTAQANEPDPADPAEQQDNPKDAADDADKE